MENNYSINIASLIFPFLMGGISRKKNPKSRFPKEFKGYHFVSTFKNDEGIENSWIGLYENNKGEHGFAKTWTGKIKDYEYYSLRNEIQSLKVLTNAVKRLKSKLPNRLKNVRLQTMVGEIEEEDYLFIMTEFIKGNSIKNLSPRAKFEVFIKAQGYINFLGKNLTNEEKAQISKRSASDYLLIYPFILVKAIVSNPRLTIKLLRGFLEFLKSIPVMFKAEAELVHRDLNFDNLLVFGNNIIVLDLQFCAFSFEEYEFITALHYNWRYNWFRDLLIGRIKQKFSRRTNFSSLVAGLSIFIATQSLTDYRFSEEINKGHIDFLDFSLSLKGAK